MQTIVKICGMTDAASIQTAIDHKVDYLGFVFYEKSPRNLTPKQATKLTKSIPSHINKVTLIALIIFLLYFFFNSLILFTSSSPCSCR